MKEKNQDFFYEIVLDDDNRIKNAFRVDARSKAAFEYFVDVGSFVTTYNNNRYAKFREVQAQFREKINCTTRLKQRVLGIAVYEVLEDVSSSMSNWFEVTYDAISLEVNCECLLFESRGIVCRHSLMVLSDERYCSQGPRELMVCSSGLINHAKRHQNEVLTAMIHRAYDKVFNEMKEYKAKYKGNPIIKHEDGSLSEMDDLKSPSHVRSRGLPKKRLSSHTET
ncbi:hypothetical protein PIB30_051787 [Stylosanthes scabra]|uniref:SWIM-type domain-containing protein n=1 Tax=Stylosanthes scabra TaxID=79078 RepID=A0ABU6SIJ5_9FABA|nr:hypothetical protein [Stylosanthes scabra]